MKWFLIILLVILSECCEFGFLASYELGDHQQARLAYGLTGGAMIATAMLLVTPRTGHSLASVLVGTVGGLLVFSGLRLALMGIYYLGPRGGKTNFSEGLPYGILGVPPGVILGAWLAGRIIGKSAAADRRLTWARTAIMFRTIVPLLLWLAKRSDRGFYTVRFICDFARCHHRGPAPAELFHRRCVFSRGIGLDRRLLADRHRGGSQVVMAEDVFVADGCVNYINGISMAPDLRGRSE
jgi:hypothetical protein